MIPGEDYYGPGLDPEQMENDPVDQFRLWLDEAIAADLPEPTAMSLATAKDGQPSVRSILLKGFDYDGFVFFSNYGSRKAQQLAANPRAALGFTWLRHHRQVRIEGPVAKISEQQSDEYYASRPRGAQLSAGISRQSEVIPSRASLDEAYAAAEEKFEGRQIPRPDYWGGYRLKGESFEFWQGRPNRLHHRIRYRWQSDEWTKEWLSP